MFLLFQGIQYRGPARADHLISWILRCKQPLTRLNSLEQFHNLHTDDTNVLVGYLPQLRANVLDPNYVPMLQCAHYLLETDPDTRVAVTSDPDLARRLHLHTNHPVRLFSWNASYSFPNKTVDSAKCNTWTFRHVSRVSQWMSLPGRKSLILKNYLGDHSLLVFSPRDRLTVSQVETIVTEISVRYRDCNNTNYTADLVTRLRHKLSQPPAPVSRCHETAVRQHCQLRSFSASSDPQPACHRVSGWTSNTSRSSCDVTSEAVTNNVDHDINMMIQEHLIERNNVQKHNDNNSWKDVKLGDYDPRIDPISGLSCKDNRTLNILLVDTSLHGYSLLADSLGINIEDDRSTTVAIVSLKEETVSVNQVSSSHNLTDVLEKTLLRWHGAGGDVSGHYGLRSSDRSSRVQVGRDSVRGCDPEDGGARSCVREVTRDQFMEDVTSASTVLLYTSSYCSQCSVASHVLHSVAELLSRAGIRDVQFR